MKRMLTILLAALLLTIPAAAHASEASTVERPVAIILENIENPDGQNGGLLYATFSDNLLLIDYDEKESKDCTLVFTIATVDGTQVLRGQGKLIDVGDSGLIDPSQEGALIGNVAELPIRIDPSVKFVSLRIRSDDGLFETRRIPVLWRKSQAGAPLRANVWPDGPVTIGIGQTVDVEATFLGNAIDRRYSLGLAGYDDTVVLLGRSIRGMEVGETTVMIRNGDGTVIASIPVTVQQAATALDAPAAAELPRYRVVVPSVNVYADTGEEQGRIGVLRLNQIVSVFSAEREWLLLSNGAFVRAKYLVPLD